MAKKRPGRYGKLYADLLSDEKLLDLMQRRAAGKSAFAVHALALAWQALHLKDGFISPHVLEGALYGTRSDANALVKCGLWSEVPGGWEIHGYAEANLTKADVALRSLQGRIDICRRYMREGKPCSCEHHSPTGDLVGDPIGDLVGDLTNHA
jgi:hypothetical protein